jgi:hypothetical protein
LIFLDFKSLSSIFLIFKKPTNQTTNIAANNNTSTHLATVSISGENSEGAGHLTGRLSGISTQ